MKKKDIINRIRPLALGIRAFLSCLPFNPSSALAQDTALA
jgi:hypothetical protein